MNYLNIEKQAGGGAGAPVPNSPNVTILRSRDVLSRPLRDGNGVKLLGDYVMKPGTKMITVYMIPSKQKQSFTSEGDEDMIGILQKFEGMFPGDTLEVNELVQELLGEDLEIIADNCVDGHKRQYGTACSPMKLKPDYTSDNNGRMHTLTFDQYTRTQYVPAFYYGNLVYAEPTSSDESIDLTEANGTQYKLEEFAAGETLDIASIDLPHGAYATIIGSGGADPGVLSSGAGTAATVLLKDDTDWTALQNATITFEVFEQDATTFLIERSRT